MRLLSLLLLAACADPIETTTLTDVGTACLADDGTVQLDFGACLSSSCDTLVSASCDAILEGSTLTITSEAVIEHQGDECTADCGLVVATCTGDAPDLADGVTVSIGGSTTPLSGCANP